MLDANGFVVDVGKLKFVKEFLVKHFDHTLLLNRDDPWLPFLNFHLEDVTDPQMPLNGCVELAKIVVVPNCGMEALAKFVFDHVNTLLPQERGLRVLSVVCLEDSKNTATYSEE